MGAKRAAGKLLGLVIVVLLLLVVVKAPGSAGNAVADVWGWFNDTAEALAAFTKSIFNA